MEYAFYLGVEPTEEGAILTLVEKEADSPDAEAQYHVRRVDEWTDGSDDVEERSEEITVDVQSMLAEQPYTGRTVIVVNRTEEEGEQLLNSLNDRGLTSFGVHLTGGTGSGQEGSGIPLSGGDDAASDASSFFVGESDLVSRVLNLKHVGRFTPSQEDSDVASRQAHGLQDYRAQFDAAQASEEAEELGEEAVSDTGTGEASADSSSDEAETPPIELEYDAYAISAALACWLGEEHKFDPTQHLSGEAPPMGEAKQEQRPDTAS